jgi:hypothetical protein
MPLPRDSTISISPVSEDESSGSKVIKSYGLYHLMAMDRIHSLLEASIMPAIAIKRRVSDGYDFT